MYNVVSRYIYKYMYKTIHSVCVKLYIYMEEGLHWEGTTN